AGRRTGTRAQSGGSGGLVEPPDQVVQLMVRVQPARVREHPKGCALETFLLQAERSLRALEAGAVGGHAEDRDAGGAEPFDLRSERSAALPELGRRELRRGGGGATDD